MRTLLVLVIVIFWSVPVSAEPGFDEKYQRDYNIFNPINEVDPKNPFNPINRYDPGNPVNPINEYRPDNPLNPINRYSPNVPFVPLEGGRHRTQ